MVVALETDLVSRAQSGDRAAFGSLYDTYLPKIYDFALGMTRSKADAEDVTSETFLKAVERLGSLKDPDAFRGWLYTIARNAALSLIDGRKRAVPTADHDEYASAAAQTWVATLPDPEARIESDELRDLVWDAAATLNPRDYQVFEMTVRHGLSSAEIAPMLGVRPAYAYILVNRLKDSVAEALEAVLLVRTGRDGCGELDSLITTYGETPTPKMRKAIMRHAKSCDACGETKKSKASMPAILAGLAFASPSTAFASELAAKIDAAWPPAPGGSGGSTTSSGDGSSGGSGGSKLAHFAGAATIIAIVAGTTITAGAQRTIHEIEVPDPIPVAEQIDATPEPSPDATDEPTAPVVRRPLGTVAPIPQPQNTPTVVIINGGEEGTVTEGEESSEDNEDPFPQRPDPTAPPKTEPPKTQPPGQVG